MRSQLKLVVNNEFFFFDAIKKEKESFNKNLKLVKTSKNLQQDNEAYIKPFIIKKKAI